MKRVVELHDFFSSTIEILQGVDNILQKVRKVSNFTKLQKGKSSMDVFTEADVHIQNTVVYNLKQLYPRARIIGEEDSVVGQICTEPPYIQPDQLKRNTISQKLLRNNYEGQKHSYRVYLQELEQIYGMATPEVDLNYYEFPDQFFEDEMVIWIDPLDGTKGFTEGHLNHITCCVGVSIKGRPRIGVIHKPFYLQGLKQGRTYFGTPECGIFIKDKFTPELNVKATSMPPFPSEDALDKDDYDLWVCGSMNRNQDSMNEIFRALRPRMIERVAGAGNKMVYMLDKKADIYINQVAGLKMWDMCAGEALVQAMMGIVCDSDHKPTYYDENATDFTMYNGLVVAKNRTVFDLVNQRLINETGFDLPHFQKKADLETERYRQKKLAEQKI